MEKLPQGKFYKGSPRKKPFGGPNRGNQTNNQSPLEPNFNPSQFPFYPNRAQGTHLGEGKLINGESPPLGESRLLRGPNRQIPTWVNPETLGGYRDTHPGGTQGKGWVPFQLGPLGFSCAPPGRTPRPGGGILLIRIPCRGPRKPGQSNPRVGGSKSQGGVNPEVHPRPMGCVPNG